MILKKWKKNNPNPIFKPKFKFGLFIFKRFELASAFNLVNRKVRYPELLVGG